MNVEVVNLFLEASVDLFKEVCGLSLEKGKPYIKRGMTPVREVTITIGVTKDMKGSFIIEMNQDTVLKIASLMMGGMEVTELNEMSVSAVSELGNMIGGRSGMKLSSKNLNIDITPPVTQVNIGGSRVNYETQTVCVPLKLVSIDETIEFNVSLK